MRSVILCSIFLFFIHDTAWAASSYLKPKREEWQVFEVAHGDDYSPRICGISNDFEDGTRLYFSGTVDGLSHVSIIPALGGFDDGVAYKVKYSILGQASGEFTARSVEGVALVGEKAGQMDFSKAFLRSQKFEISVDHKWNFNFDLASIHMAFTRFKACLGVTEKPVSVLPRVVKEEQKVIFKEDGRVPPPPVSSTKIVKSTVDNRSKPEIRNVPVPKRKPSFRPEPRARYTEKLARELKGDQDYMAEKAEKPKKKPTYRGFMGPKTEIIKEKAR